MRNKLHFTLILLFAIIGNLSAQMLMPDVRPPVIINGSILQNSWTGGTNSPIFSQIDFNGDGKLDIITFDVVGNRLSCYLNIGHAGQAKYRYAPQYVKKFPADLHGWLRTYDFDCDGDMDLFSYGNAAMIVYQNNYAAATGIKFSIFTSQINTYYGSIQSNLYVNTVTIPALVDMDNDGDMDVLSFPVSGSYIEYHKNYAMDSTGTCGGFLFHMVQAPWAHFYLSALSNVAVLGVPKPSPAQMENITIADKYIGNTRHSGSALWGFDYECDGDIDLLNGDILGSNLLFLQNGAPPDSMVAQDTAFPSYDTSLNMENIPCPTLMDVDNDGKKDLVVTPFASTGEDYYNVWLYNNQASDCTPSFHRSTTRFLVDQMIDVGTSARPSFLDVDGDGLKDLLVANHQYYNNANPVASYSRLAYFHNSGTATFPIYTLVTTDFANCSSLGVLGLHPTFGDIDGDGDQDMLLGTSDGTLIFYQNTAGAGNPVNFVFTSGMYQNIDVGNNSAPQLIDVDHDGLLDLVIGERVGNLNYFHNTGTVSAPVFTSVSIAFGGVSVLQPNALVGNSVPLLFDHNGNYELLVGSESGHIYQYNNIDGNLGGTFALLDTNYQGIYEPSHATIAMADIDGDNKFDLMVGCEAGGLRLFTQRNPLIVHAQNTAVAYSYAKIEDDNNFDNGTEFTLYPSPVADVLNIRLNYESTSRVSLKIMDMLGKIMVDLNNISSSVKVDVHNLTAGIYFVRISSATGENILKFIKQ